MKPGVPAFGAPLLCEDCRANTGHTNGLGEYFMVRADIWQAVMPTAQGFLCVGCLERRLGRELTRADFMPDALRDRPHPGASARLLDRLARASS